MSDLAHIIVGLDRLSPAELEIVRQVITLKTGTGPPSTPEKISPKSGLFGRRRGKEPLTPALVSGPTNFVDPLKWELMESHEFYRLIQACEACSAPLLNGIGRKKDMHDRVTSIKDAWDDIPQHLMRPFRASETRATGRDSPSTTSKAKHTEAESRQRNSDSLPAELSSGSEDGLAGTVGKGPRLSYEGPEVLHRGAAGTPHH